MSRRLSSSPLLFLIICSGASLQFAACNSTPELDLNGVGSGNSKSGGQGGERDGDNNFQLGGNGNDEGNGTGGKPSTDLDLTACEEQEECPTGTLCKYDLCIPDLGSCDENDDCPGDSYCDAEDICVPYGVDPNIINDVTCKRADEPPSPIPTEQCRWTGADGAFPDFDDIYTTPVVADLNLDDDPNKLQPSIVATTWKNQGGSRIGICASSMAAPVMNNSVWATTLIQTMPTDPVTEAS